MSNWWYQLPAGSVLVGGACVATSEHAAPAGRDPARRRALSFSVVTGIDYVRLDRDRAEVHGGYRRRPGAGHVAPAAVPARQDQRFHRKPDHAWGYYTVAKDTSAPLVFAVERSLPDHYREFPPRALIPPALDRFAEQNGTPAQACKILRQRSGDAACTAAWRERWDAFWRDAEPRFGHVLTWAIPAEARSIIPLGYHRVFAAGDLEIYSR